MADEFDTAVAAVVTAVETIDTYVQVTAYEPLSLAGIQAAVIMDSGEARQRGTQRHGYYDTLLIRSYIPIGADPKTAEETARQLWTDLVSVFTGGLSIGDTVIVCNLGRYTTRYHRVSGVVCRVLDAYLDMTNILATTYA